MQPLAIFVIASGLVMVIGVLATLVWTRRVIRPARARISRWQRHGSIPLAAAALALGVVSRGSGQTPSTHDAIFATAGALLLGALLCTAAAAVTRTRR